MQPTESFQHRPLLIDDLKRCLPPSAIQTFGQLIDVLRIPNDFPRFPAVLAAVSKAIETYGTTLQMPNWKFRLIESVVNDLKADITDRLGWTTSSGELSQPLLRRLLNHAPYAVFLSVGMLPNSLAERYWVALGAEVAVCLATGMIFSCKYANELRKEITPQLFGSDKPSQPASWEKTAAKKQRLAAKLFEANNSPDPSGDTPLRLFDLKVGHELSHKLRYSSPRQRQALLDRHHQSEWQLQASAKQLLTRAESGDQTALLTMIAFQSGLSLKTTKEMPIRTALTCDDSIMGLNLSDGTILTNLACLTPASARPAPNANIFRAASWIAVKPLPMVVWILMQQLAKEHPMATTLGELLPDASTSGRQPTLADDDSVLKATTARFLASAGPVAVGLDIDRLSVALLTNDFGVIPGSKLYYALVRRESLWDAATRLFSYLGWGPAAPFIAGLPVGSHIVPQQAAIADWLRWMADEVKRWTPGRHCSIDRLVMHHNAYAHFCASVTVWLVAAREAKAFHFTTSNLDPNAAFASLLDKSVGAFPGDLWIPLCPTLRRQLALWRTHCTALECRLRKLGLPPEHLLAVMLKRFKAGEAVQMFFAIDVATYRPRYLGSADLTRWWPASHRFSSDFGRHFWETELRESGVRSSRIDLLMRHITQAVESHCSTHMDTLDQAADEITSAQTKLLQQLDCTPIPGLASRHKESS